LDELFKDSLRTQIFMELEERRFLELFLERGSCELECVSGSGGTQNVRKDSSLDKFLTYYTI
jgi:hypothetical protein